jgi:hypothetical protein
MEASSSDTSVIVLSTGGAETDVLLQKRAALKKYKEL